MKYHLITLGCQMNLSDSERVSAVLESMGYQKTENEEEASLLGMLAAKIIIYLQLRQTSLLFVSLFIVQSSCQYQLCIKRSVCIKTKYPP